MTESVMFPPINPKDLNSIDEFGDMSVTKDGKDFPQVTVNVFDSGNAEMLKMQTKLSHDNVWWLDESQINSNISKINQQHLPVSFETNNINMTVTKRKMQDLLLTGRFALENLDMPNKMPKSGNNKQGHIVIHPDSIDHWESLPQSQKEYLGHLETGDSHFINDSVGRKFVKGGKGTDSFDKTVEDYRSSCVTKKDTSATRVLPEKSETFRNSARKSDEDSTPDKQKNLETCNERSLVEKETQTEEFVDAESIDGKKIDDVEYGKQNIVGMEGLMIKPSIKLCNLRLEEIKEMKNLVKIESEMDTSEGKRIWEEVDAMIKRSIPKGKLRKGKKKNENPVSKSFDSSIKHSIEFRPRFRRTGKEYFHFVPKDHIWAIMLESKPMENTVQLPLLNGESTFDRVYGKSLDDKEAMDMMYQHIGRDEETFFSENDRVFIDGQNMQRNDDKAIFLESFPFVLEQLEKAKYEEMLRILDQDPGVSEFNNVNIRLIHPVQKSSSTPPAIHLPPNGACSSSTMMATPLPRLTPSSTPLPTGITQPPPRSHSSASLYVPYPPKNLSNSMDFMKMPQRINPLRPPPPRKRINWTWETENQHYENEKRRLLMQKREHTRYHSAWAKAFYGAPAEKEAYRRHYREVLKQQMDDRDSMKKDEFQSKIKESERALAYDKQCQKNDANEFYRKHGYLQQFRDGNKQQMEDRWAQVRFNKNVEDRIDRERLRYNPINWSCTLK